MLSIDRLSLRLPPGMEHRARDIVRLVADRLASLPLNESRRIERLVVPTLDVNPAHSDGQIASRIANGIADAMHRDVQASPASGTGPVASRLVLNGRLMPTVAGIVKL